MGFHFVAFSADDSERWGVPSGRGDRTDSLRKEWSEPR